MPISVQAGDAMQVTFNESMSCSVFQRNKDVSANRGRYRDLKLNPEQAAELPEAKDWPALATFMKAVNLSPAFFTSGCMATGITPGGHAAPYVDIAFYEPPMRLSPNACRQLAFRFLELHNANTMSEFILDLCPSSATFPDGETVSSLRCWFLGSRVDAEVVFPLILEKLNEQNPAAYAAIAASDYAEAMRQRADKQRQDREFRKLLLKCGLVWLVFSFGGAWILSGFGWLGMIGGFLAGAVVFPIGAVLCFLTFWSVARWWHVRRQSRR